MTTKKKAVGAATRTALDAASNIRELTPIRSRIKVAIVCLAVWGVIPAGFATWLIQRGGLKDA